ncbi:MAG: putative sensor-like histidine kinase [Xylophilus sp.]|nr:MAG: putative sensor-like histidine kinase [Xylophilus sp.]
MTMHSMPIPSLLSRLTRHVRPSHRDSVPGPPRWRRLLLAAAAGLVIGAAVGYLSHTPGAGYPTRSKDAGHWLIRAALVLAAAGQMVYRVKADRLKIRVARAERSAAEAQLRLLESQLEPHMMFNTLANLRALIATDPVRAERMLDHLIDFLRATLGASRAGRHTLADEFARLADYLALMAVRMAHAWLMRWSCRSPRCRCLRCCSNRWWRTRCEVAPENRSA